MDGSHQGLSPVSRGTDPGALLKDNVSNYENKIKELGFLLPEPAKPAGIYQPVVMAGNLAFLSGQLGRVNGTLVTGKVGKDLDLKQAQAAAQGAGLHVLSLIQHGIGWKQFKRIVKLSGFVQVDPAFTEISAVINGASELLAQVLGDAGGPARTSVGVASLPQNAAIEIEVVVEIVS